jgi:hypothetical protein
MMQHAPSATGTTSYRAVLGWVTTWVLLSGLALLGLLPLPGLESTLAFRFSHEEATPDSILEPPEPYPSRQRAHHLTVLGVDRWHTEGVRGQGIKIAILDSGFRGYRKFLGRVLPEKVKVHSFREDGDLEARDSQHGILCGEVIHALAPDAQLLLANWDTDSPDRFLEAVQWAREQGAHIISCSVIMPSWSDGNGGGLVNSKLTGIVGPGERAGDVLYFASAGNTAQRHWHGAYLDAGEGYHEWKPGRTTNELNPWGNERVSVELYWPRDQNEYELEVTTEKGEPIGECVRHRGADRCSTVIHFQPNELRTYQARVRLARGKGGAFHMVVLGGSLQHTTAQNSVACPADNPAVLAVGAVQHDGKRASYSSCGPNARCAKPDLVAPVPFASLWRSRPFSGTSAAAPQAAALAALYWSRHPDWNASQVRKAMLSSARDLGPVGYDPETGQGVIALPAQLGPAK